MSAVGKQMEYSEWAAKAAEHRAWAEEWTLPLRDRKSRSVIHPVYDFIFIYYSYPPSLLEQWHPGCGVRFEDVEGASYKDKYYSRENGALYLDPEKLGEKGRARIKAYLQLCEAVAAKPATYGCYGMHEWAMVYKGGLDGMIRHEKSAPLRLSREETDAFVENWPIVCTHYDAFRFFTSEAKPFNKVQPTADTRLQHEQPGCLHANMDLYKWAAGAMPWTGSAILRESFELAMRARVLDMKASPYDLKEYGFDPIKIETAEGRAEYERQQKLLSEDAAFVREKLMRVFRELG